MTLLSWGDADELALWLNKLHRNGVTERGIEAPWAQRAINACRGTWLDVGYAWTERDFWKGIDFKGAHSVGLDFIPPHWEHPFAETIQADVTEYEFKEPFDLITCISTLEHIGCDVKRYKADESRRENPIEIQREVVAKLRCAGRTLLASVPFGTFEDHGWFVQYDLKMVVDLEPTNMAFYGIDGIKGPAHKFANCLYRTDELRAEAVALMEFTNG